MHVIAPSRRYPEPGSARLPFGPVEVLPAAHCRASFCSDPLDEGLDEVLYRSYLTVVWFQDDLAAPVAFVTAAVGGLAWDRLAQDRGL